MTCQGCLRVRVFEDHRVSPFSACPASQKLQQGHQRQLQKVGTASTVPNFKDCVYALNQGGLGGGLGFICIFKN